MTAPSSPSPSGPAPRVTVVGAGTMGHGIAHIAALAGCPVTLTDERPAALEEAIRRIETLLAGGLKRGKLTENDRAAVHARLHTERDLATSLQGADVVIEAVVELLPVKQRLFAEIERHVPPGALLATNTSSLSIAQVAAALRAPARLLGMHFFNTVHAMRLVEVVPHERSDPALVERATDLARRFGKEPIVVRDSPGFASSRLGVVLGLEAMRMVEQGIASARDIDTAMELGYNHPMGPLKLTDLVGLDVRLAIAEYLHATLRMPHYEPPRILREKVAAGELGKKTGKGFYTWGE